MLGWDYFPALHTLVPYSLCLLLLFFMLLGEKNNFFMLGKKYFFKLTRAGAAGVSITAARQNLLILLSIW